jgi:hypothetical protein
MTKGSWCMLAPSVTKPVCLQFELLKPESKIFFSSGFILLL